MEPAEKILVVDDEPQVLVALEDLLSEGFVIFKADCAEQARAIIDKEDDIAVVVTDQLMPRGTGDELLASLSGASNACAIMLTGYADLTAVVRAVNEGRLYAYVTKPWDPSDLRLKVASAANHFRLARQLEYEQRLLHDLMNHSPDGIYFKDTQGRFERVNRAFASIVGSAHPEALVGQHASATFRAHAPARVWPLEDARILKERKPGADLVRQYPSSSSDGSARWVSETIAPILDKAGSPIGLVGIARDVTERVKVQEELRHSEQLFRDQSELLNSILDGMVEGVVVADENGRLVFFNRHAERLLGQPAKGHGVETWATVYGLVDPATNAPLQHDLDPLVRAVRERSATETEVLARNTPNGERLFVISAAPLTSVSDLPRGGVALLRDVTEQRALEQRLAQSEKMEAIGRLAGGVAHDFNNLLGVIQGYGELVLDGLGPNDVARDDVREMLRTAERAATLTRRLLEFSRQRTTSRQPLSITAIAEGMVNMLKRVLGSTISFHTELGDQVGDARADAGQIEQVIMNLVINARDAMPLGGTLRLSTYNPTPKECDAAGLGLREYVALQVSDTGSGMSKETRAKIFEPFFTTKPLGRGTGLGLSTVYGIVNQSEGEIRVESELGLGTTFTVYLPRVYEKPKTQSAEATVADQTVRSATVLLVENDPALRSVIARVLRQSGHRVLEAENSFGAVRVAEEAETRIDLLLTDVVIPGETGLQLANRLRSKDQSLRVLFVSGQGTDLLADEDLEGGGAGCLEKPFTPSRLLEAVQALIGRAEP
ncbi:MAG TPA: response regulator [Polyangiaceae bacterium]|nr:response regulator [Polyangiaceae bacterium]